MKHPNFYRCEISAEHCDFFTIASGNCYLGRYSYWDSGTVIDESIPMTYHKSGMYSFFQNYFRQFYYVYTPNHPTIDFYCIKSNLNFKKLSLFISAWLKQHFSIF